MGTLAGLMATGRLLMVVDRIFPWPRQAAALRHLMSGEPVGRVVLVVE